MVKKAAKLELKGPFGGKSNHKTKELKALSYEEKANIDAKVKAKHTTKPKAKKK